MTIFEIFNIGIGPSSSHTMGPMRAATRFVDTLRKKKLAVSRITIDLFGSLGLTGRGHGSGPALILGLLGETPELVDPENIVDIVQKVKTQGLIHLGKIGDVPFSYEKDIIFHADKRLSPHPNAMEFSAYSANGKIVVVEKLYSIGGGAIADSSFFAKKRATKNIQSGPFPFDSAVDLLRQGEKHSLSLSEIMMERESALRSREEVRKKILDIWCCMQECVKRGRKKTGVLPGGLKLQRRAHKLHQDLLRRAESGLADPLAILDWVNLYALAVNEENAAGGRVVTAPTNGASGIIPAVLHYYKNFCSGSSEDGIIKFLLTAGAIGILYRKNASISGAEVGCQGEVGVACSMAAAGLTEALGGSNLQVENAAEIAMEHNLGLTCDPVQGLVQIPCIERNAMGAILAINSSRISLSGDGHHYVSLDKVIETMLQTGIDMQSKYKETSQGGLAVNITEC